jgi:S-formylglutathione hydrolase
MYDYIVDELPQLLEQELPLSAQRAISGHSMGGHGALVIALRNPQRYSSVSAFSPICQPSACAWGEKAFSSYLGDDRSSWAAYDASSLLQQMPCPLPLLVDQGLADQFYPAQLRTEALQQALAAQPQQQPVEVRLHDGYDHSYYFISSFIEQHLRFHATWLQR